MNELSRVRHEMKAGQILDPDLISVRLKAARERGATDSLVNDLAPENPPISAS
jgi:hypothetical protein